MTLQKQLFPFLGGFIATLLFHQGVLALFYMAKLVPFAPFDMSPTSPLGVPKVISLAFFGGLWGNLIWFFLDKKDPKKQLLYSIILGAIGPTAVALLIVMPLKGMPFSPKLIPGGLILNGAWGFGLWGFMKVTAKMRE